MRTSVAAPRAVRWTGGLVLAIAVSAVAIVWAQQPAPPQPRQQADPGISPKAVSDQARNELEVLEAQLDVHNAVVEEFKVRLEQSKQEFAGLEKVGEAIPQKRLLDARAAMTILQAQVKVKQAERRVGEVRVKHARQRLVLIEGAGAKDHAHHHSDWWCVEHGVPEEICSLCSDQVAAKFKKAGDWCRLHDRAKSQCFKCEPGLYKKYEAMFVAKYGKKPPRPPKEEFQK